MTEDEKSRESPRATALLDGAVAYLSREGIEDFSLANLASALGTSSRMLIYHFGSRDELLAGLSQHLPDVVDHLTPDGRLPTEEEAARLI